MSFGTSLTVTTPKTLLPTQHLVQRGEVKREEKILTRQMVGDGLKLFSPKLQLVKNHDVMRRFCRALNGCVGLEEEINCRRVSIRFRGHIYMLCRESSRIMVQIEGKLSSSSEVAPKGNGNKNTYILFPS